MLLNVEYGHGSCFNVVHCNQKNCSDVHVSCFNKFEGIYIFCSLKKNSHKNITEYSKTNQDAIMKALTYRWEMISLIPGNILSCPMTLLFHIGCNLCHVDEVNSVFLVPMCFFQ